jgi:outer membrane receptor protein involved in Fe transport
MRFTFILLCSLAVLVHAPFASAAARLTGVIVDASGAPVPGATVSVNTGGQERTAVSADDGSFAIDDVVEGDVLVKALAPGFAVASATVRAGAEPARLVLQPAPLVQEVTVTASRGAERLQTAASTTVVTSAELLNSGAGALDDALRNTPGFSLFRRSTSRVSNPTTQGVTLRGVSGSGSSRTMVLADGLPLNDAFGSWVYWNRVPLAAIERVEVVRGATGDLYGADALGGVIQVLTFAPGRPRVRAELDGGSHDTGRVSAFGSVQAREWHGAATGEWLRTDGVVTVAPEARGPVDVPADSDYGTGFVEGGYQGGSWHSSARLSLYDESRGNGTPLQVNDTNWKQGSGEAGGSLAGGAWLARGAGGTQTFYQTFTAVAADRRTERLTTIQNTPSTFGTFAAQWTRAWGSRSLLVGGEGKRTKSTVEETRYSFTGVPSGPFFAGGTETSGSVFARISLVPLDALTIVVGGRGDFWRSNPTDSTLASHEANFFSPRVSAALRVSDAMSLETSVYRAYRTPTLNELHRGFRVGNVVTSPNPRLDPERLTGVDGGILFTASRLSARVTGFWNQLDDAITNVTIATTPILIMRQRQNTDTVRAMGVEMEADVRPAARLTLGALVVFTHSRFTHTPAQPALEGNWIPQVPNYQVGGSVTYADPRGFTGSMQLRAFGDQYDDDLNVYKLDGFGVVDVSASQALRRGLHVFVAVENLFDTEYDVGRTPIRTIGWPRTARAGVRVFLP